MNAIEEQLKFCKFDKYYKRLIKKLKNKTVIIYGSGTLFQYIQKNYDLSLLNIIGISDGKYLLEQEGQDDLGYKIVPFEKLEEYEPDYLLLGLQNYLPVLYDFASTTFKDKKTRVIPLVKIPLWKILKDIWF